MPVNAQTFRGACCDRLGIPSEAFEETVLWQCLYPCHVPVGKLQWWLDRAYFKDDLELIRAAGDCMSVSEVRLEISDYRYHRPTSGFRRRFLRARVSGQRLLDLAAKFIE